MVSTVIIERISVRPDGSPIIAVPPPISNRLVACHLHALHQAERHKVTNVGLWSALIDGKKVALPLLIISPLISFSFYYLRDQTTRFQFVVKLHYSVSIFNLFDFMIKESEYRYGARSFLRSSMITTGSRPLSGRIEQVSSALRRAASRFPRRRADVQFRLRGVLLSIGLTSV